MPVVFLVERSRPLLPVNAITRILEHFFKLFDGNNSMIVFDLGLALVVGNRSALHTRHLLQFVFHALGANRASHSLHRKADMADGGRLRRGGLRFSLRQ